VTKGFADFLVSLNTEGVAYVVIGIAVLAHLELLGKQKDPK
jgi:hypothetical protein